MTKSRSITLLDTVAPSSRQICCTLLDGGLKRREDGHTGWKQGQKTNGGVGATRLGTVLPQPGHPVYLHCRERRCRQRTTL